MGDYFPTRVFIGGELKRGKDLSEFLNLARNWTDSVCADPVDREFLESLSDEHLELADEQASPDKPDVLTSWCQEHNLTYWVAVDGKYEYDGEVTFWQPGMDKEVSHSATQDGEPTFTYSQLRERLDDGKTLADCVAELEPAAWTDDKIPPLVLVGAYDPEYDG